jgi:hypothetical protein
VVQIHSPRPLYSRSHIDLDRNRFRLLGSKNLSRLVHYHFLPSLKGHGPKESVELNKQLQLYFEYVVNLWLAFLPEPNRAVFPRNFSFPVTVPFSYLGDLPADLCGVPQLAVSLEAYERPIPAEPSSEPQPDGSAPEADSGNSSTVRNLRCLLLREWQSRCGHHFEGMARSAGADVL